LPKLTKEDINHFNRSITKKTEAVIVSQQWRAKDKMDSLMNSIRPLKKY
jgi:hypothetical protein